MTPSHSSAELSRPVSRMMPSSAYTRSRNEVQNGRMMIEQQDALRALRGAGDGVRHRIAEQQADERREKRGLQRIEVRKPIHFVGEQILEIAETQRQVDVPVGADR